MILNLQPNTKIKLTPGAVYDAVTGLVGPYYALPAGCSIIGRENISEPYPILRLNSPQGYAFKAVSNGTVLSGFNLIGGGLFTECASGLIVDDLDIVQQAWIGKKCGLEISASISDVKVTRCKFSGNNGAFGLYSAAALIRALIANNEFSGLRAGCHIANDSPAVANNVIEQNWMHGITAQGFEIQGAGLNWLIQDNWVEAHALLAAGNNDAYSYSLPLAYAVNTKILNNVSIQPTSANSPDGIGVRIIFEVGGKNLLMSGNYGEGGNHIIAGNGANGSGSAVSNLIKNYRESPRNSNGNATVYSNNGPDVHLALDLIGRGRPQRFTRFDSSQPQGNPTPTPTPTPVPSQTIHLSLDVDLQSGKASNVKISGGTLPGTL